MGNADPGIQPQVESKDAKAAPEGLADLKLAFCPEA